MINVEIICFTVLISNVIIPMSVILSRPSHALVWLAQAVRKEIRNLTNKIFTEPITRASPPELKSIALLITGKTLNTDNPGDSITLIDIDHKLRRSLADPASFILCPQKAKQASSLAGLHLEGHKDFFTRVLQNVNRIVPLFSREGEQMNHMTQDKFLLPTVTSPLFNIITGYYYFNCLAKAPRMEAVFVGDIEQRQDGTYDMSKVFERRVVTEDGSEGDFVVGPRLMALTDFYIATSIFGGIPQAHDFRDFYELRVKQYKALNGVGGARDMRAELKAVLEDYLNQFPHAKVQVRGSRKSGPSRASIDEVVDLTEEELRASFAMGPAGGAKSMQFESGESSASVGAGDGDGAAAEGASGGSGAAAGAAAVQSG